mgnify:CR=1 FL=1
MTYLIYGQKGCSNCETLKQILDTKQINYKYKSIPEDLSAKDFSIMMEAFNIFPRSFPQVVKIEELIFKLTDRVQSFSCLRYAKFLFV